MDTRVATRSSMHACMCGEPIKPLMDLLIQNVSYRGLCFGCASNSSTKYIICIDSMQEKELEGVSEGGSSRHQSPAGHQASITTP